MLMKKNELYAKVDWDKAINLFKTPIKAGNDHQYPTSKEILHVLASAGAIGLIFMFPGAALGIGTLLSIGKKNYRPWKAKHMINQLKKQKYVQVIEKEGKTTVIITKKGMVRALSYKLDDLELNKPKKWDGKWRVVIFDIPDKYKKMRDIFRMRLKQLGLCKMQESVYVSPYGCFNEIEFLRELYGIAIDIKYLMVEKMEDDDFFRQHFELS